MPIDHPVLFYALLPVAGCVVALLGSFTGLGGAYIMVPLLAKVFGLPYNAAIGCTAALIIGQSLIALGRHWRLGHVDKRLAVNFLAGSIPGAVAGRLLLQVLKGPEGKLAAGVERGFDIAYAVLIVWAASAMLVKFIRHRRQLRNGRCALADPRVQSEAGRWATVFAAGLIGGLLAGILAIGGGIVTVPVLSGLLGVPIALAIGTSICQMPFTAAAATLISFVFGETGNTADLRATVIVLLLAGAVPGALVGPWLLKHAVARFSFPAPDKNADDT